MAELEIEKVHALSRSFARHHQIRPSRPNAVLTLGPELDRGGFGALHPVHNANGTTGQPQLLAKLFTPDPAAEEHARDLLARLIAVLENSPDRAWQQQLLALPFLIAQARLEGESRLVALMLDLRSLGYEPLVFDEAEAIEYQMRPVLDRLEFAYRFARGAQLLESISFVHADINFKNLLFNEKTGDVQIIDFDAGALVESGDERPITVGAADEFVPPEVKCGPLDPRPADETLYTAEAERWSVGMMVGVLLFGVGPLFFLAEFSRSAIDAYAAQSSRWPEIEMTSPLFLAENRASYEYWKPVFEGAPGEMPERFAEFAAAGSKGGARPSASAWVEAMEVARKPPSFAYLRAEPDVLVEGTEVLISWRAEGADGVDSKLFGSLEPEGSETFVVGQATRFEFEARNRYGKVAAATNPVRVVPLPRMERIPVPAFPDLRLQVRVPAAIPSPPLPPPPPPRLVPTSLPSRLPPELLAAPRFAPLLPPLPSFAATFAGWRGDTDGV